jgi:hypothetical protein
VAKLGPNSIMLRFKVRTNGLLCLLDLKAMHLFVNPSIVAQFEWVATKVAKPIRVQLAQGTTTSTCKVVFGAILECDKVKFTKHFTIYALDGSEAILRNIFLNVYHVNVLKRGLKLKVIIKLVDRSVSSKVEY